jgi:hypothetical protein
MMSVRKVVTGRAAVLVVCGLGWVLWQASFGAAQLDDDALADSRFALKVEDFLRAVATDNVGLGLETLLAGSPLGKDAAQLDKLRTGLPQALEKYGRFKRSERLKVERIGQSLVRCTWLYHCTNFPVVWKVLFYRPDPTVADEWMVIGLEFDTDYSKLPAPSPDLRPVGG